MEMIDIHEELPIRLLLADDHPVVLEGLRRCLTANPRLQVVGEARDGRDALDKAKELKPDVVLLDINMPVMNGIEAARLMRTEAPSARILVLSMHDERNYIIEIVRAGARGYILKDASPSDLIHAIEEVHAGRSAFSPAVSRILLNEYVRKGGNAASPARQLSRRETEVLSYIADGFKNKEIADKLNVGVRTIETHRERIMRKLDIHSTAGLTRYALEHGIIHSISPTATR